MNTLVRLAFPLTCTIIIVLLFYIKNKQDDNSISIKVLRLIIKEYPLLISLLLLYISVNFINFSSKYDILDTKIVYNTLYNQINKSLNSLLKGIIFIFKSMFETQVLKIIIISYFATKILTSEDMFLKIKYFISQIKEINFKDFSLKTQEAKIEQSIKEKEIETIIKKKNDGSLNEEEAEEQIRNAEIKKEIIAIMIDNAKIVRYIDSFINKSSTSIALPKNLIPSKIALSAIDRLFEYELGINSIKLKGIIPEKVNLVKEVFNELTEKGIIYISSTSS